MRAETVLILGGTAEAAALARRIAHERPATRLVVSLAGRTRDPAPLAGETRIGGFGGAAGLAEFLRRETVSRLIDATHPFAAGISRAAAEASDMTGVARLALVRPAWDEREDDRWLHARCLRDAATVLPSGAKAFLALGRQHLASFAARPDVDFAVRMIDPPLEPLPFPATLVLGRPSADWRGEAALLRQLGTTYLVSRNSGGAASYAKIRAARRLALPVVMIGRMAEPAPPVAHDAEAVMRWLDASA